MRATNTAGYDAPIGLTADPVVFTLLDGALCVLLARRLEEPQRGMFSLPGGFVGSEESPEQTAERKLREKTGVGGSGGSGGVGGSGGSGGTTGGVTECGPGLACPEGSACGGTSAM